METVILELNGREAVSIFLQPIVTVMDILKTFRIMPRVTSKRRLYFMGSLEGIIQKNTGCGWNAQGGLDIFTREVDPQRLKVNLELCADEFWDTIFEDALGLGSNIDESPQVLVGLLIRRINEAMAKDIYTLGWHGDKTSANAFTKLVDGIFVKLGDAANAGLITVVDAGSGAALADGAAYSILDELVNTAPLEFRQLPDNMKAIYCTSSIYQNLQRYYESLGSEMANKAMVDGIPVLMFRGYKLYEQPVWDLKFTSANTHCALFTIMDNIVCATDITDPAAELRIWTQPKEEMLYIKAKFKLDFNYIHEKYLALAM